MARQKFARNTVAILLWTLLLVVSPLLAGGAAGAATLAGLVPAAPPPQVSDPETDLTDPIGDMEDDEETPVSELPPLLRKVLEGYASAMYQIEWGEDGVDPDGRPKGSPTGWQTVVSAEAPPARTGHAMTVLTDERVLLFGGKDENGVVLGDTWLWNPATGEWTAVQSENTPSARQGHSMTTLADGQALIFGGRLPNRMSNDFHLYTEDGWTPRDTATSPAPAGRYNQHIWERGGTVYVQGGIGQTAGGKAALYEDLWLFDLQSNIWKQGSKPPGFISPNARPAIVGDKAYLLDPHLFDQNGGTFFMFDMKQGVWEKGKLAGDWPHGERSGYAMVQVGSSAYMFGGQTWDTGANAFKPSTEAWVMDLQALTWRQLAEMPYPVVDGAAGYLPSENSIILWGGKQGGAQLLDTLSLPDKLVASSGLRYDMEDPSPSE